MVADMTQGKPIKVITTFAIPLFVGNVFQLVYNMVDSIVVGNYVGPDALAEVGSCTGAFSLLIALLTGLTGGMSVLIAQYFGAKDHNKVKETFISATAVNLLTGLFLTVAGVLLTKPLLVFLNTPVELMEGARTYLTILFLGTLANCLYNGMSAVLRAMGNSLVPLVILIIASLLNVGLDLFFVIVCSLEVAGVAIATVLAQLISAVVCIIYVFWKIPELRFGIRELKMKRGIVKEIIRIGVPTALSSAGVSISVMFLQRAINGYGPTVMAAYTVGNRTEQIGMCLAFSIGMAVGTFCGQNIGAGRYDRVKKGLHTGYLIAIVYAVAAGLLMFALARPLAGLFTDEEPVIDIAVGCIYVTSIFAPVLALVFVYQNFLRSAGDIAPTVWMSVTEILARSVLAFVFSWLFGYVGIWWVTPVGWMASLAIGFIRYRSGRWQNRLDEGKKEGHNAVLGVSNNSLQTISRKPGGVM